MLSSGIDMLIVNRKSDYYIRLYFIEFATAKSWAAEPSLHLIVTEPQPSKASEAMLVTLSGIVTVCKEVH